MRQEQHNQDDTHALVMEWLAPLETLDRSFEVEFWQRQSAPLQCCVGDGRVCPSIERVRCASSDCEYDRVPAVFTVDQSNGLNPN